MASPVEAMIAKLSQLLGVIDGKLRNKLDQSGGTVDHLTVTNQLHATADYAHALKVAKLLSLAGQARGSVLFSGAENAEIVVSIPELADKADASVTYTKDEVNKLIKDLIGLAPEELDTIYELAEALKGNQDSIGTIITELAKKANSEDVYSKASADARFAQQTALDNTNQELSSVITQLTAAFQNGADQINGV